MRVMLEEGVWRDGEGGKGGEECRFGGGDENGEVDVVEGDLQADEGAVPDGVEEGDVYDASSVGRCCRVDGVAYRS